MCIRDDKRWKNCSGGHETIDWTKQIEDAYLRKNPGLPTLSARHDLHKRQGPPLPGNGTSSSPAPSASQTNDNGQQGAPLSVFVSNVLDEGMKRRRVGKGMQSAMPWPTWRSFLPAICHAHTSTCPSDFHHR